MKRLLSPILVLVAAVFVLQSCTKKNEKPEIWIYTSIYKNVVSDLEPKLKAKFPEADFKFFQAGSEEVAAKVGAEELAGGTRADILIFSDRFWFEEMAKLGRFHKFLPPAAAGVDPTMRNPEGFYTAVSYPVMVLVYNSDAVPEDKAPKTFKEMSKPEWKNKFTTGSPLASGTNFTTVAFLQKDYGWDWFKALRANDTISEGGNSSVMRRVQTKERPVGWVLLENAIPAQEKNPKIKIVYPEDGAVIQNNVLAIVKKKEPRELVERVADWFFQDDGQQAMLKGYMYSTVPGKPAPKGAKPLAEVKTQKWDQATVEDFMNKRESIKEEFMNIMLQ
jgi:iron(III) transport system substrate-binding protein